MTTAFKRWPNFWEKESPWGKTDEPPGLTPEVHSIQNRKICGLGYFTQQQTPPGQHLQVSQTQTPVSQQPQSHAQQQDFPQQLPAQAESALGAAVNENKDASKKTSRYINNLQ